MSEKFIINNFGAKIDITQFYGIIDSMQESVYWKNTDGVYLGCNEYMVKLAGKRSRAEVIGKTDYDMAWKDAAEKIQAIEQQVMKDGKTYQVEETSIFLNDTKNRFFLSTKSPLYNDDGRVIGVIGTSTEITTKKQIDELKLENEIQKTQLQEQRKFTDVALKVAHDIRSPLASLRMITSAGAAEIPENIRVTIRNAAISIDGIANSLLNKYKKNDSEETETDEHQPVLVSLVLSELLTSKTYQYKSLLLEFNYESNKNNNFVFINVMPVSFKRMLSNLVNNAVDSCGENRGEINLKLDADNKQIKITIEDNGKGMHQDVIDKIMQNIAITNNKKDGRGIGFSQVNETLKNNSGEMFIDSKIGQGTKITLAFPRAEMANWLATEIKLHKGDTVVILDDDASIHDAWRSSLREYVPAIKLWHCATADDAIYFINSAPEKNKIFLLADFELLKQNSTGLDVIEQTAIKRSILVTSHYANQKVLELAAKIGTKILPKQLASEIPITIF